MLNYTKSLQQQHKQPQFSIYIITDNICACVKMETKIEIVEKKIQKKKKPEK